MLMSKDRALVILNKINNWAKKNKFYFLPNMLHVKNNLRFIFTNDGKCPCSPRTRTCPCASSITEIMNAKNTCRCRLYVGERYLELYGYKERIKKLNVSLVEEIYESE